MGDFGPNQAQVIDIKRLVQRVITLHNGYYAKLFSNLRTWGHVGPGWHPPPRGLDLSLLAPTYIRSLQMKLKEQIDAAVDDLGGDDIYVVATPKMTEEIRANGFELEVVDPESGVFRILDHFK